MNTVVLICAAIASLGGGLLLAYAVCRAAFALLRAQARPAEPRAIETAAQAAEL